jgi:hypothetical protein
MSRSLASSISLSATFIYFIFLTLRVAWHHNAALLSVLYVVEWEIYIADNQRRHWLEGLGDELPLWSVDLAVLAPAKVAWEQQQTSAAYVSMRQQHTSADVGRIGQEHTSGAYVRSIRQQHTSAHVSSMYEALSH